MMDDGVMTNLQADLFFPGTVMPMDEQFMQMMWAGVETSQPSRPVLSLAEALPEPELGSPDMPSVGSVGHWNGTCKPCAFMARGCTSGVNCPFCHLCDVNEKKRRRKDKSHLCVNSAVGRRSKQPVHPLTNTCDGSAT